LLEGYEAREEGLIDAQFPPGSEEEEEEEEEEEKGEEKGENEKEGVAYKGVEAELVGMLLGKAASSTTPGEGRISAGILKAFWKWGQLHITGLVRACIRVPI